MAPASSSAGSPRDAARVCCFWIGPASGVELALVRDAARGRVDLVEHRTVAEAIAWEATAGEAGRPTLVLLAADRPGRWPPGAVVTAARRWPLAPLIGVVASLGDGRRRSGTVLVGIEEVAWHDLPGRLECWLAEFAAGGAAALGTPATARREERLLDALDAVVGLERSVPDATIWIAGGRGADLDGIADLLALSGRTVAGRTAGRPALDVRTPIVVWDVVALGPDDLAWLRMLAANRPGAGVVLLESFPRGDVVEAALRAGAGAVLGRPLTLEALEGTLRRLERQALLGRPATGLGVESERR